MAPTSDESFLPDFPSWQLLWFVLLLLLLNTFRRNKTVCRAAGAVLETLDHGFTHRSWKHFCGNHHSDWVYLRRERKLAGAAAVSDKAALFWRAAQSSSTLLVSGLTSDQRRSDHISLSWGATAGTFRRNVVKTNCWFKLSTNSESYRIMHFFT